MGRKTALNEARNILEPMGFRVKKVEAGLFEVWRGNSFHGSIMRQPDRPYRWAVSHNAKYDPVKDKERFRFDSPLGAIRAYNR